MCAEASACSISVRTEIEHFLLAPGYRLIARLAARLAVLTAAASVALSPAAADARIPGWKHKKQVVAPHRAWLDRVAWCESRSDYKLTTTGNGYWFAFQWHPDSWAAAGGRLIDRRPVGWNGGHPSRLEQRYRAVRLLQIQGRGAWPVCGR